MGSQTMGRDPKVGREMILFSITFYRKIEKYLRKWVATKKVWEPMI